MDRSRGRVIGERLRIADTWPFWLPATIAFLTGLVVFIDGATTPSGWMVSPLFVKFTAPYVILVIIDLALARCATRSGGLRKRHALVGITVATVLASVSAVLLASEVIAAIALMAAVVPAWYATTY